MEKVSLGKLIFKQYARTALLTILTVEALLLLAYFGSNTYFISKTEEALRSEVGEVVPRISALAARNIRENFESVERETASFALAHADLFKRLGDYAFAPGRPVLEPVPDGSGSWYQSEPTDGSGLYIPASSIPKMGKEQWLFATNSAALDPLYKRAVDNGPSVVAAYINLDEPADLNRLYPYIPHVWEQYPSDIDMKKYNFFYLADAENNTERKVVWTEVYWDPAGNGWMLSCIAPVYVGDVLKGVVGLDVTVSEASKLIAGLDLPWQATAFLVAPSGEILAKNSSGSIDPGIKELPDREKKVQGTIQQPAENNIGALPNKQLAAGLLSLLRDDGTSKSSAPPIINVGKRQFLVTSTDVFLFGKAPGWKLLVLVEESVLFQQIQNWRDESERIGWALVGLMALFYLWFFQFLRKRARKMAVMIASPMQSELRAKDTELAYTRGLYESASGYLHNVGNAITRMESSLMDLDKVIKSSEQYPEAFDRIKAGGPAGAETLKRFEEVLVGKTVPALKSVAESIARIKDSIRNAISHQQAGFKAAVRQASEEVDLSELVSEMCALFRKEHPSLSFDAKPGVTVRSHRDPLVQGLDNIIRNAIQASPPGGHIHVTCEGAKDGALVTVTDEGRGISAGNLAKVTRAGFTTKQGGHGLGLHSFAVFLSASGGRLAVKSKGLGKGTTVTVDIRNA